MHNLKDIQKAVIKTLIKKLLLTRLLLVRTLGKKLKPKCKIFSSLDTK